MIFSRSVRVKLHPSGAHISAEVNFSFGLWFVHLVVKVLRGVSQAMMDYFKCISVLI